MNKAFKLLDITAYLFAIIIVILTSIGMWSMARNTDGVSLVIESDNTENKTIDFENLETDEIIWLAVTDDNIFQLDYKPESDIYDNIIRIENKTIYMEYANCPDQLCTKTKPIINVGQTIVCLPNKLLIKMAGGEQLNEVDDISH